MIDVLVVDDDFMVARVHAGFVERTDGFRVAGTARSGQEALDLAEQLLAKGYEVFGLVRGQNNPKRELVEREVPGVQIVTGDLTDLSSLLLTSLGWGEADPARLPFLDPPPAAALAEARRRL